MADTFTPAQRSRIMAAVKSKNTTPELVVRRLLHSLGYRYRLHVRDLPGTPDMVFPRLRAALFVHGCFWHLHKCRQGRNAPAANRRYWQAKRKRNFDRDRRSIAKLRRMGWRVMVLWECQLKDPNRLTARLMGFLNP